MACVVETEKSHLSLLDRLGLSRTPHQQFDLKTVKERALDSAVIDFLSSTGDEGSSGLHPWYGDIATIKSLPSPQKAKGIIEEPILDLEDLVVNI
ncbi:MAG TPA: hypothetical protein VMR41_00205 [Patescibacteria group bacterium]|nr:hypothetical protein [Patescibacteria group bacterium]